MMTMPLPGNQPGNYVSSTATTFGPNGALAQHTYNDSLVSSYAVGADFLDVRDGAVIRICRRSDGMTLRSNLGTIAAAQSTASGMASAGQI
jgi:hypothetical protein